MKPFFFRLTAFLLVGILLIISVPTATAADSADDVFEDILQYNLHKAGASSVQAWIDGALADEAGTSAEWYILALSQSGNHNFSRYETALCAYLDRNTVGSASSREKYALALAAVGSTDSYIYKTLEDAIGKQGIMSYVYGLHLLTNGYTASSHTVSSVKETVLSLQRDDGGWAVTGTRSDVDVTAMTVGALAPYYRTDTAVAAAIDRALALLADRQYDTGEYASYGVCNAESAAQVLIALCALGIDAAADSRFIQNGNTLFDALSLYRLDDGSFAHQQGGAANSSATVQVFLSMVAYRRMQNGQDGLYSLDRADPHGLYVPTTVPSAQTTAATQKTHVTTVGSGTPASIPTAASSTSPTNSPTVTPADGTVTTFTTTATSTLTATTVTEATASATTAPLPDAPPAKSGGYKPWVSVGIVLTAAVVCAVLWLNKKRKPSNFLIVALVAVAALTIVWLTTFQSVDDHYQNIAPAGDTVGTVTLTIRCDTIADRSAAHIPDDGVVLETTVFSIGEGDTVYDVLQRAAAAHRIHLETSGGYVEGIAQIYEWDHGDLSGWMYTVNGKTPSVGCAEFVLFPNDEIVFSYTCNMGEDL